ncbi:MAG: 4Fe-4S binding protein [Bacteroidales bacterium]|nr:4Fe-4S binding protein [Bacteroidales bacterium]MCF8343371.1 4Fe-4S binding protein [Bacteroidales bacterium]MCF8350483.1 4Fe-4S binding protein [Bacteroidales bacterium]
MTNKGTYDQLVFTEKDKCRVCYTCVRECPVKAIKISDGQAEVMHERCIACGNCVKVCSQGAKVFLSTIEAVERLLESGEKTAAIVAPSFPAEFSEVDEYGLFVGMLRKLGFDYVNEVAFGADMVSREYKDLLDKSDGPWISSDCPAIVNYIRHYHSNLIENLAPIASPMVAVTRILKKKYGDKLRVVFIGPCIAKKAESSEVDAVLTFKELKLMFEAKKITPGVVGSSQFDPPHAGKGSIFPISRGLLQNMGIQEDISEGNVTVAAGRQNFREAINEFENRQLESKHLELLCCDGCILGAGMSAPGKKYARRARVTKFVQDKLKNIDNDQWEKDIEDFKEVDYRQEFDAADRQINEPSEEQIRRVLKSMGKTKEIDLLNCGACGYDTCREHAIAIVQGLAENEMCLPFTIERLHNSIDKLNFSNRELANAKMALKQSEKLAHMGQLSAGIAHELNNPLGVITMYSNILKDESKQDDPVRQDLELIVEQTDRCRKIVGGLLNFARQNQVKLSDTDMDEFIKNSISSIIKPKNVKISYENKAQDTIAKIDRDQMMQVLTNLEKNAVEAMPQEGELRLSLEDDKDYIIINISDTGGGIPPENMEKLFTPFFTTKEIGKGTGLGLPLVYGIVKMHKGKIDVKSNTDTDKGPTGTTFILRIPRDKDQL